MTIEKIQKDGKTVLALSGRLDTVTSPQLQEVLIPEIEAALNCVELDFTELVYVSSAGLRVLLTGEKSAKAANKSMVLKNVCAEVMEIFEITGFAGILNIVN